MKQVWEVFWRFLALGCVSFGGPAAHIGYFRKMFVEKIQWLDENDYARLVALSQFLPGPASSQVGFAIGLRRGGFWGGVAAFMGFTLPSFFLLYGLSQLSQESLGNGYYAAVAHGLKLLAVVVVADAVVNMFGSFCKNKITVGLAVLTAVALWVVPGYWTQMMALLLSASVGLWCIKHTDVGAVSTGRFSWLPLILFGGLFIGLPLLAGAAVWLDVFSDFYQAGSLVFGGGHVVLPLLQETVGNALPNDTFLMGYAAAQAVPGPMFSMAAFMGAELSTANSLLMASVATAGVFLPGFLLVLGLHNAWEAIVSRHKVASAIAGVNASVVGLLIATLYQPVFTSAVGSPREMGVVLLGIFLLRYLKLPIVWLVCGFALIGPALSVS